MLLGGAADQSRSFTSGVVMILGIGLFGEPYLIVRGGVVTTGS
jgi:hypothetical protein